MNNYNRILLNKDENEITVIALQRELKRSWNFNIESNKEQKSICSKFKKDESEIEKKNFRWVSQ